MKKILKTRREVIIITDEILKAMRGKKEHKIRKWWHKNGYKILNVVLSPLMAAERLQDKINYRLDHKQAWSEERATEILNYYIPRKSEWDAENKTFYFFDNGMGWHIKYAKRYLKLKDRRFWKIYCDLWGGKIQEFLINKFELKGFTKELGDCTEWWTEIYFILDNH